MPDRHTATTITDAKLDRLYAKLAKAQKWRNDYARRLDSVLAVVNPVADAPLPHSYDDSERAVRDFAREVRAAIDGDQPGDPAQPVRGTLEVQLNGQWTDITEHATSEPQPAPVLKPGQRVDTIVFADSMQQQIADAQQRANRAELAIEDYRGAVSHALGLGTSAPWDVIHARAAELHRDNGQLLGEQAACIEVERRLKLAHQARRAKVAQLDDIKRAMLDTGLMAEGDPYSHADLADFIRQTHAGDQAAACREDAEHNATRAEQAEQRLAAAQRLTEEQAATIRRMLCNLRDTERRLTDARKAYTDADARATLRACQLVGARDVARHVAERADRYAAAWRSARKRARVLSNELTRRAPLNGQYAAEVGRLRGVLRDTENDLADARRRLAEPTDRRSLRGQLAAMADRANRPEAP